MTDDIFLPNNKETSAFKDIIQFDSIMATSPLPEWVLNNVKTPSFKTQTMNGGSLDFHTIKDSIAKDMLTSEIPTNTEDIERQLQVLFEQANRHNSHDHVEQDGGAKKKKRRSSKKYNMRVDKHMKRAKSKKSSKKAKKCSEESPKKVKKSSRKVKKSSKKTSKKTKKTTKKRSRKQSGGEKSKKVSKKTGGKRELPPGLVAHRGLVEYIQKTMGVKGGPLLQTFVSTYRKAIKAKTPGLETMAEIEKAKALFDKESSDERKARYNKAKKSYEEKRTEKKAAKAATKAAAKAASSSSLSDTSD